MSAILSERELLQSDKIHYIYAEDGRVPIPGYGRLKINYRPMTREDYLSGVPVAESVEIDGIRERLYLGDSRNWRGEPVVRGSGFSVFLFRTQEARDSWKLD